MFHRSARRRLRGFTFLEIMFVVVIIGVLMAVAVPRIVGGTAVANETAAKATLRSVRLSLDQYYLNVGRYPDSGQGLAALIDSPGSDTAPNWRGPYMEEPALDPWGRELVYRSPGEGIGEYDLWSLGPDGKDGTEDDIQARGKGSRRR